MCVVRVSDLKCFSARRSLKNYCKHTSRICTGARRSQVVDFQLEHIVFRASEKFACGNSADAAKETHRVLWPRHRVLPIHFKVSDPLAVANTV